MANNQSAMARRFGCFAAFALIILAFLSYLVGCASTDTGECSQVDQSQIYQGLDASYDQSSDTTTATATLRFAGSTGTTLDLDGKCAITNNQYTLSKSQFLGTSYSGSGKGLKASESFTFTDNNGKTYTNSATIPTMAFSGTVPTTVSEAVGTTISFTPALSQGESAIVTISPATGSGVATAIEDTVGATSVTLPASTFTGVSTGAATISLKRSASTTPSQVTEAGGTFTVN